MTDRRTIFAFKHLVSFLAITVSAPAHISMEIIPLTSVQVELRGIQQTILVNNGGFPIHDLTPSLETFKLTV